MVCYSEHGDDADNKDCHTFSAESCQCCVPWAVTETTDCWYSCNAVTCWGCKVWWGDS